MIGRRSFLSLLGLSPIAPSLMQDTVPTPSALHVGGMSVAGGAPVPPPSIIAERAFNAGLISRREYGEIMRGSMSLGRHHGALDHDLEAAKSFSAVAKRRMQDERDREAAIKMHEERGGDIWSRVQKLAERLGLT